MLRFGVNFRGDRRAALLAVCAVCVLLVCAVVFAQETGAPDAVATEAIAFSASVDKTEYPANAEFELAIVITWKGHETDHTLDRIEPPEFDNLRILGSRTETEKAVTGQAFSYRRATVYRVRPEKEGRASIGPATAYYREAGADDLKMMATDRIELMIGPPEFGFFEVPRNVKIVVFAGALVVLAGVLFGVRAVVVRRARVREEREAAKEPPAAEQYRQAMEEATARLQAGDFPAFYRAIGDAVRKLAVRHAKLFARSETTADLVARLSASGMEPAIVEAVEILLRECDTSRYTGRTPTHSEASVFLARAKGLGEKIEQTPGSAGA